MCTFHQFAQALVQDVGVDLRRGNVRMAQQLLHHSEVGTVLQQVGSECVAQHVRGNLAGIETGGDGKVLQVSCKMLACQMSAVAMGGKQPRAFSYAPSAARRPT